MPGEKKKSLEPSKCCINVHWYYYHSRNEQNTFDYLHIYFLPYNFTMFFLFQ